MYVFMHTCIIYFIMILFCSHRTPTLMCGWVLKQLGLLKSYDFLALWEGGVRKQWRGIMCVLLCSSGRGGHSASLEPLKEGRKGVVCNERQGTWIVWPSEGHGQWVRIDRSRKRKPGRFCVSWLLAQGQYSVPMLLTCSSLQCDEASHCARWTSSCSSGQRPGEQNVPPLPYNDFVHVAKAKRILNSSWELSQILRILYWFFIVPSYTGSHLTIQSY